MQGNDEGMDLSVACLRRVHDWMANLEACFTKRELHDWHRQMLYEDPYQGTPGLEKEQLIRNLSEFVKYLK